MVNDYIVNGFMYYKLIRAMPEDNAVHGKLYRVLHYINKRGRRMAPWGHRFFPKAPFYCVTMIQPLQGKAQALIIPSRIGIVSPTEGDTAIISTVIVAATANGAAHA